MCGIWGIFGYDHSVSYQLHHALEIAHRGPDCFRIETLPHFQHSFMAFHRLSIMDEIRGQQPMRLYHLPHIHLIYNGEIYNYKQLIKKYEYNAVTGLDGEVIIHLYHKFGIKKMLQLLDGVFALAIFDTKSGELHFSRDTMGVRPLFTLEAETGELGISSEAKGLVGLAHNDAGKARLNVFIPGHYATYKIFPESGKSRKIIEERFSDVELPPVYDTAPLLTENIEENIRNIFIEAVRKRLMAERRIGCLLSGGLDSSLVAAIVVKLAKEANVDYQVQTFSIGLKGSPDLISAKKVANMLNTEHHEIIFTPEDAFEVMEKVSYSIESYGIAANRSSMPMYLLGQYIRKNTDTVVVFSGEGSDEVTQGYLYFHKAPSDEEAHQESIRLLRDLYLHDNLRADRTMSAHGLEVRVPFLDKHFVSYYLSLPKDIVRPTKGIEKYLLRSAFDFGDNSLIPKEILWRTKEAFSDGVSKTEDPWSLKLEKYARSQLLNKYPKEENFKLACLKHEFNTPKTYEALLYRELFENRFQGKSHLIPYFWLPKWMGNVTDPSQRVLENYKQ